MRMTTRGQSDKEEKRDTQYLFSIKELTPPSFKICEIISMYSTILWAVSIKKQVTTASHAPAWPL